MVRTPWLLYTDDGEPKPDTGLIVATLERAMELSPNNPGAKHLYIHAVEPSKDPDRGLLAADPLSELVPDAGHLLHMPTHRRRPVVNAFRALEDVWLTAVE